MSFGIKKHSIQALYYALAVSELQHTHKKKKKKEVSKNTCMKGRRLLSTLYVVHICKLLNFCIKASYVFNRNAEMVICPQVMTSCLRCFCLLGMQVDLLKLKIGSFIRSGIVNIKKQHCGFICLYILYHC